MKAERYDVDRLREIEIGSDRHVTFPESVWNELSGIESQADDYHWISSPQGKLLVADGDDRSKNSKHFDTSTPHNDEVRRTTIPKEAYKWGGLADVTYLTAVTYSELENAPISAVFLLTERELEIAIAEWLDSSDGFRHSPKF